MLIFQKKIRFRVLRACDLDTFEQIFGITFLFQMSPKGRKRAAPAPEDFFWDCSVCTYKNNPEAFKCIMCDVRKGTSTRKSRINPDLVAVQVQQALLPPPPNQRTTLNPLGESSSSQGSELVHEPSTSPCPGPSSQKKPKAAPKPRQPRKNMRQSKLKDVDHSTATTMDITVDDVTIQITEYQLKKKVSPPQSSTSSRDNSVVPSNEESVLTSVKPSSEEENGTLESESGHSETPSRAASEEVEPMRRSS